MFDSIIDDIKHEFRSGNMLTRLIIINIGIFMVTALIKAFAPTFYNGTLIHWIALPSSGMDFLFKPWTMFTHMFVHSGFWHIIWNMLIFYWFGRIVGDLIGDRHMLPIYLLGGIAGGVGVLLSYQIVPQYIGSYAIGASAAVMALVIVAGIINPDHEIRLLFLGIVKIKFIILFIIFMDLIGIGNKDNTGGHIAHIFGMLMGWFYMAQMSQGNDLGNKVNNITDKIFGLFDRDRKPRKKKSPLKVKFKSDKIKNMAERRADTNNNNQVQVDQILDKIKQKGYESLSDAEKDILYKASKK
ncbi:MAG: membrane associated rhomboid family serine protease [Saprospiraceae bacterium]|jgi:membrane associated rhomboid family serine protease